MKILYAAADRPSSFFSMDRFSDTIVEKNIDLKVAAYKSSLGTRNADYTLDCLYNFTNPKAISFNGNYNYYINEIQRFQPNLIITDLELFTSLIAIELGIELWQVSPLLLYFGVSKKIQIQSGVSTKLRYDLHSNYKTMQMYNRIIKNADKRLVMSHLCDTTANIELKKGFEWVRPDFWLTNRLCGPDTYQCPSPQHYVKNVYKSILETSTAIYGAPSEVLVADAFYNQIPYLSGKMSEYYDMETIIVEGFDTLHNKEIVLNDNVKFISQFIEEKKIQ